MTDDEKRIRKRLKDDFVHYANKCLKIRTKDGKSRLDQDKKHNFEWSKDLDDGFFPAPWQFLPEERDNTEYANYSKKVFGVDASWEWHPYLGFSKI